MIVDAIRAARRVNENTARLQWRAIRKKYGPIEYAKVRTVAWQGEVAAADTVIYVLSKVKGQVGEFFGNVDELAHRTVAIEPESSSQLLTPVEDIDDFTISKYLGLE